MSTQHMQPQRSSSGQLICRLRFKPTEGCQFAGEVEIENSSAQPIEIIIQSSELEHLDLRVSTEAGDVVSAFHYGALFSPFSLGHVWKLLPGEKFTKSVSLLATVPDELRRPGQYVAQAVYQYQSIAAVSEKVEFELLPSALRR